MDNSIKEICDIIIENYRYAIYNLRYDGDYINHFGALTSGYKRMKIEDNRVKAIRSLIKRRTMNMSPFRGDILYILSFLLVENDLDTEKFVDELLDTFNELVEENFIECGHLVIAAYAITKYGDKKERKIICKRMKYIFNIIKQKYGSCTKQDDYVLCALLSLENVKYNDIYEKMDNIFDYFKKLDLFNKNELQGLTNSILLNNAEELIEPISKLIIKLEENDLKIANQFLQLVGFFDNEYNIDNTIYKIKEILKYLSNEETEYYYYIDKDFRNMIAVVIVFMYNNKKDVKYVDEILAFGVYSFLVSKNQGILNEVLA